MSKDSTTELQVAYYTLLNNNVTLSGTPVPVYDEVPATATYPHIQFGNTNLNDDSTKQSFQDRGSFSMSVVDRFSSDTGTRSKINNVVNQVKQIVRTRPVPFNLTNFNVITSVVESDVSRKERTSTFTYYIRELRFGHIIEEK